MSAALFDPVVTEADLEPATRGACPGCGHGVGTRNPFTAVVECRECETPWPRSYWLEQGRCVD